MTDDVHKADEKARLIVAVEEAFSATPLPSAITDCDCPWCSDLLAEFQGRPWLEIEDAKIAANWTALASLSPEGFHYILPAYLRHSLKHFNLDSEVCEYTIYSLTPNAEMMKNPRISKSTYARLKCFNRKQVEVILQFLALVSRDEELSDFHSEFEENVSRLKGLLKEVNLLD